MDNEIMKMLIHNQLLLMTILEKLGMSKEDIVDLHEFLHKDIEKRVEEYLTKGEEDVE